MNEDSELGWLNLTDKSRLVLTALYVFQRQDRGIFGASHEIVPLNAITTVRLSWRRSRALIALGAIALIAFLFFLISSMTASRGERPFADELLNLTSSMTLFIQYGALVAAIAALGLFWFVKSYELQILAVTGSVGGTPRSYEESQRFCSLLVSELANRPVSVREVVNQQPTPAESPDRDWKL